jgi:cytoskeletal protein RodZ
MLKVLFSRLTRLLVVAIAGLSLLLGSVACSTTSPEDLPKLESVTDSLRESQELDLTDAASVEATEDALETLSDDTAESAAAATEAIEETATDVTETVEAVTDAVQDSVEATAVEVDCRRTSTAGRSEGCGHRPNF